MGTVFTRYAESLGFKNVKKLKSVTDNPNLCSMRYRSFDAAKVRAELGRAKLYDYKKGVFLFVVAPDKGIFVNTSKQKLILCNTRAIVKSVYKRVQSQT